MNSLQYRLNTGSNKVFSTDRTFVIRLKRHWWSEAINLLRSIIHVLYILIIPFRRIIWRCLLRSFVTTARGRVVDLCRWLIDKSDMKATVMVIPIYKVHVCYIFGLKHSVCVRRPSHEPQWKTLYEIRQKFPSSCLAVAKLYLLHYLRFILLPITRSIHISKHYIALEVVMTDCAPGSSKCHSSSSSPHVVNASTCRSHTSYMTPSGASWTKIVVLYVQHFARTTKSRLQCNIITIAFRRWLDVRVLFTRQGLYDLGSCRLHRASNNGVYDWQVYIQFYGLACKRNHAFVCLSSDHNSVSVASSIQFIPNCNL